MFLKLFILLFLSSFTHTTQHQEHCSVPRQPLHSALESCWHKLQNDWFVTPEQSFSLPVMEDALLGFHYDDDMQIIDFSSNKIFSYLRNNQIAIVGDLKPRVLIIALDQKTNPIDSEIFNNQWSEVLPLIKIQVIQPLWDLEESKILTTRELRGHLSQNFLKILSKYSANILLIIQGDFDHNKFDMRLVYPEKLKEFKKYDCNLYDIKNNLKDFIVEHYQLPSKTESIEISLNRKIWTFELAEKHLGQHLEINKITPKTIDKDTLVISVESCWQTQHWSVLAQEYPGIDKINRDLIY